MMVVGAVPFYRMPIAIVLLTCAATFVVSRIFGFPVVGVDDANIFFAYARNIAAGHGFVFNVGGERVEGFTSLLWTLICALVASVTSHPEPVLLGLNIVLVSVTAMCCVRSMSRLWACVFLILLFCDARFVAWNTITLMDTALWCSLIAASAALVLDERLGDRQAGWAMACLTALAILARPEALLWMPVVLLLFYVRRRSARVVAPAGGAYVVAAGLLTIFRVAYFGFPLPNTFYAKVSPSVGFNLNEGARYLSSYVLSGAIPLLCVVAIGLSAAHLCYVRFRDTPTLAITVLAAAGLLMPVAIGGDHFGGFRFYQTVYPIFILSLTNCLSRVLPDYVSVPQASRVRHAVALLGTALLAAAFVMLQILDWTSVEERTSLSVEFAIAEAGRELGDRANHVFANLPNLPSIGAITVGGLQYAYDGAVVDLMGLNNLTMAHNGGKRIGLKSHAAFEKSTFYELKPMMLMPLVQSSSTLPDAEKRSNFADYALKGLLNDPQFQESYRLAQVTRHIPPKTVSVAGWFRKDFLANLRQSGWFVLTEAGTY